jgi:alpha-glucosidase
VEPPTGTGRGAPWIPDHAAWWQRGVIYQVYPRSFFDASGDGIGDLAGVREKVDYLAWLGSDGVWFSPIYTSPEADLGYDISDYRAVDPRFGTIEDFDALLAVLHERDIRLVLDLVPNHTSDRHPWFVESRSGLQSRKHNWYVWRPSRPDGTPPNNWESYFGGPAWEYADPPGMWYLHSFDRAQPDLNWENPDVRRALQDVMRFWLDRGVDGFRVDVLWLLSKDPEFRDNPPNPDWREGHPPWLRLQRAHSEDGPRAHEFVRLLRSVVDEYSDRVMIGEVVLPPARAVAFHGERLDEAHMPHNFALTELRNWTAEEIRTVVEEYESLLPAGAWPNWLLGDHDFPRIRSRIGEERLRLAHMLLLTLRGTPTWYYGDELGLPNAAFTPARMTLVDPQAATTPERDRLAARTPMQWSTGPHAGFSDADPWLPIASGDPELTVERQREDEGSALTFVRALIGLRRRTPALSIGTYRSIPSPSGVFSFSRWHPDGPVQVHLNFGDAVCEVELPPASRILLSTSGDTGLPDTALVALRPSAGVIVGQAAASHGTDRPGDFPGSRPR